MFAINELLSLKLEDGRTNIYVKGELFTQCKFLLLNMPLEEVGSFSSIEEAIEKYSHNIASQSFDIHPKDEFWAHCSNLQVWFENKYDCDLIHSNLSFPLLKEMANMGDLLAVKVFKKEIIKKISSGNINVLLYLFEESFIKCLTSSEIASAFSQVRKRELFNALINILKQELSNEELKITVSEFFAEYRVHFSFLLIDELLQLSERYPFDQFFSILKYGIMDILDEEHYMFFTLEVASTILLFLIKVIKELGYDDDEKLYQYIIFTIKGQFDRSEREGFCLKNVRWLKNELSLLKIKLNALKSKSFRGTNYLVFSLFQFLNDIEDKLYNYSKIKEKNFINLDS